MEMSRREQDELERAIALSLADTGRGEGAGVAANDVEAQIIQQVIEMSRREQDEFERAMALSLADTGRDGVEAGMGVAASASREADSESHIAATPHALRLPERESVLGRYPWWAASLPFFVRIEDGLYLFHLLFHG